MSTENEGGALEVQAIALHAGYLGSVVVAEIDDHGTEVRGVLKGIEFERNGRRGAYVLLSVGPTTARLRDGDLVLFPDLDAAPEIPVYEGP